MTAPVYLGNWPVGSPEWHEARAHGIGGSEIAPILGLSPYESRFSLWHRKASLIGPVEESPEMEWGKRLEPVVIEKFLERHQELFGATAGTWHADGRPWHIANPDHLLFNEPFGSEGTPDALLEVKTARYDDEWGDDGTDQIPLFYRAQCLWYLDVFPTAQRCHVAVLFSGSDYREYLIERHEPDMAIMRTAAAEFLDSIATGRRPDIDDSTATYQTVRELHPDIDGKDVEIPDEMARQFIIARAAAEVTDAAVQQAKNELADAMGDARRAIWDGAPIARREARNGGKPYVVAARNLPDLTPTTKETEAA